MLRQVKKKRCGNYKNINKLSHLHICMTVCPQNDDDDESTQKQLKLTSYVLFFHNSLKYAIFNNLICEKRCEHIYNTGISKYYRII